MNTIENTHHSIFNIILKLRSIISALKNHCNDMDAKGINYKKYFEAGNIYVNLFDMEIEEFESQYILCTINIMGNYYSKYSTETDLTNEYYKIINSENFPSSLTKFALRARQIFNCITRAYMDHLKSTNASLRGYKFTNKSDSELYSNVEIAKLMHGDVFYNAIARLNKEIKICEQYEILVDSKKIEYDLCVCGIRMSVNTETSELVCENCSMVKSLEGTPFDDGHLYGQEGNIKSKSSNYEPNRRLKLLLEHIQGNEKKEFPKEDLEKLEYYINRDCPKLDNVYAMRRILREAKLTKYNDNTSLLIKIFTGVPPPNLSRNLHIKIISRANRIMEWLDYLKKEDGNRPYYLHFIYKAIEDERDFASSRNCHEDAETLNNLLKYIYLQSHETKRKHDELYKQICELDKQAAEERGESEFLIYRASPLT